MSDRYIASEIKLFWKGINNNGQRIASGLYYYLIKAKNNMHAAEEVQMGKFIMLK